MDGTIMKRNELVSQRVIKMLQSRHHEAYYAADKNSALKLAMEKGSDAINEQNRAKTQDLPTGSYFFTLYVDCIV